MGLVVGFGAYLGTGTNATHSISTLAFLGRVLTATHVLAGISPLGIY